MSRPIFEPTLERMDASLSFGTRQLFRRPPRPTDTNLPCFRALQYANTITVPGNGDPTPLEFDEWQNGDPTIFDPTVTGGLVALIETLVGGVYLTKVSLEFGNNITVGSIGLCVDSGSSYTEEAVMIHPAQPLPGLLTTGRYSMTHVAGYPPIWIFDTNCTGAPCEPKFRFQVAQDSGSSEDAFLAMIEIYWLGTSVCTTLPDSS